MRSNSPARNAHSNVPAPTLSGLSPELPLDLKLSPVFKRHFAMGSVIEITMYGINPTRASNAMDRAFDEIDRLENVMSIYKVASELSRVNRTAYFAAQPITSDLYQVIQAALHYSELSQGAFDITVGPLAERWKAVGRGEQAPDAAEELALKKGVGYRHVELLAPNRIRFHNSRVALDLGAIGKGYAVDRAAALLRSHGIDCALLNFGGSTFTAIGCPPCQSGWRVHLCDPSARLHPYVLLNGNSVSTSQQTPPSSFGLPSFGHIIDTAAGEPLESSTAVSVVADSATDSDGLSTAFLLMGATKVRDLIEKFPKVAAVWISTEGLAQTVSSGPDIWLTQGTQMGCQSHLAQDLI